MQGISSFLAMFPCGQRQPVFFNLTVSFKKNQKYGLFFNVKFSEF